MRHWRISGWVVAAVMAFCWAGPRLEAQPAPTTRQAAPTTQEAIEQSNYLRFVDNGSQGGELETSTVTFSNDKGVHVSLVAAIHIADTAYYQGLNKQFENYDAVLYELVKPKAMATPAPGTPSHSGVGQIQNFLKDVLDLNYQLDVIDYRKANFVHADMDKETFEKEMADRGESFETLIIKQMMKSMNRPQPQAQQDPAEMMQGLVQVLCRPDSERQLKLMVARNLDEIEASSADLGGPKGSVIVTERNKAALKVLKSQLAAGKKNLAIFYGAAHMPDMASRLEAMGFKPVSIRWNEAWDLTIRPNQPSMVEQFLNGVVQGMNEGEGQ